LNVLQKRGLRIGRPNEIMIILEEDVKIAPKADDGQGERAVAWATQ
jgi:hypothetical protein